MPVWVTLKSGEIRKYNKGVSWSFDYAWTVIRPEGWTNENNWVVAKIKIEDIHSLEFDRPCETGWAPDFIVEHAIDLLLSRGKGLKATSKLADLTRLLRGFNPQRQAWK